jgi:hypothetical protein
MWNKKDLAAIDHTRIRQECPSVIRVSGATIVIQFGYGQIGELRIDTELRMKHCVSFGVLRFGGIDRGLFESLEL